ncbi:hypothetical protein AAG570_002151 [Ranatra chinensis]|uniref:Uncharacterized protein n=1 Tax=Ranatra chinensis TaxID=642074 RepID=A0ABD0Y6N2_9HEMI
MVAISRKRSGPRNSEQETTDHDQPLFQLPAEVGIRTGDKKWIFFTKLEITPLTVTENPVDYRSRQIRCGGPENAGSSWFAVQLVSLVGELETSSFSAAGRAQPVKDRMWRETREYPGTAHTEEGEIELNKRRRPTWRKYREMKLRMVRETVTSFYTVRGRDNGGSTGPSAKGSHR